MDELRSLLAEITVQDICLHANLLENLRLRLEHTIVPLVIDPEIACAPEDFMCFEYALGLIFSKEYLGIRKHEQETRMIRPLGADEEFVAFLIEKKYLTEIQRKHAEDGDLIMYFHQGKPTHAGVLAGSKRVISKWGKGLLLEHAPLRSLQFMAMNVVTTNHLMLASAKIVSSSTRSLWAGSL